MTHETQYPAFVREHREALEALRRFSSAAGARSDYVQGGGGNTSAKLDERWMAIKASGYTLGQIALDRAYAVLDYRALRDFYAEAPAVEASELEALGAAAAREATRTVEGLDALRPSVEAGFHSILPRFVLHSHAVWSNLIACAVEAPEIAAAVMDAVGEPYALVPYINPGAELTFAVAEARRAAARDGVEPDALFLLNHGLVVADDDAEAIGPRHEAICAAAAAHFGLGFEDWPQIAVEAEGEGAWRSATPWLRERLRGDDWQLETYTVDALYPDQLVFLAGQIDVVDTGGAGGFAEEQTTKARIDRATGLVHYRCSAFEAEVIEQTLVAVAFIREQIAAKGYHVATMSEAGRAFIAGWESEAYRRQIAREKGQPS